jgi:hypothetical protein
MGDGKGDEGGGSGKAGRGRMEPQGGTRSQGKMTPRVRLRFRISLCPPPRPTSRGPVTAPAKLLLIHGCAAAGLPDQIINQIPGIILYFQSTLQEKILFRTKLTEN